MKDQAHLKGFGRLSTVLIGFGYKPGPAYRFQKFVDTLLRERGVRGALLYLDSFGSVLSNRLYGTNLPTPVWVSPDRHLCKRSINKELLRRLTKIKRAIVCSSVTDDQWRKFHSAVTRPSPALDSLSRAASYVKDGVQTLRRYSPGMPGLHQTPSCFPLYVRKELVKHEDVSLAYTSAFDRFLKDLSHVSEQSWFSNAWISSTLEPLTLPEIRSLVKLARLAFPPDKHVGHVCSSQEPGAKLRCFASPRLFYQSALTPLYKWCFGFLSNIPEDSVYDQMCHIPRLQGLLDRRVKLYAFDLTNATDSTPWGPQSFTLAQLGISHHLINLVYELARAEWKTVGELTEYAQTVAWTEGQPLGLKPSFGIFSLFHHALVRGICFVYDRTDYPYVILGDDIVIWDDRVAAEYASVMQDMGVEISHSKSFVSDRVTEFAGTVVTRDESYRPGKWRCATQDNLLSFLTQPGFDYEKVVPKFWVKLIRRLYSTPVPYGFFRPDLDKMDGFERLKLAQDLSALVTGPPKADTTMMLMSDHDLMMKFLDINRVWDIIYAENVRNIRAYSSYVNRDVPCFLQRKHLEDVYEAQRDRMRSLEAAQARLRLCWSWPNPVRSPAEYRNLTEGWKSSVPTCYGARPWYPVSTPGGYAEVCRHFANIIYSIVVMDRTVEDWLVLLPALRAAASTRRAPLDKWDLISLVYKEFPLVFESDFSQTASRFIQILRRISDKKDVVPSYLAPMPRKVGTGTERKA